MDYRTERAQCVVCGWLTFTACPYCADSRVCKGCMADHINNITYDYTLGANVTKQATGEVDEEN